MSGDALGRERERERLDPNMTKTSSVHIQRLERLLFVPPAAANALTRLFIILLNVALSNSFTVLGSPSTLSNSSSLGNPPIFPSARMAVLQSLYVNLFDASRSNRTNASSICSAGDNDDIRNREASRRGEFTTSVTHTARPKNDDKRR